jgi:hypothetical protein
MGAGCGAGAAANATVPATSIGAGSGGACAAAMTTVPPAARIKSSWKMINVGDLQPHPTAILGLARIKMYGPV